MLASHRSLLCIILSGIDNLFNLRKYVIFTSTLKIHYFGIIIFIRNKSKRKNKTLATLLLVQNITLILNLKKLIFSIEYITY